MLRFYKKRKVVYEKKCLVPEYKTTALAIVAIVLRGEADLRNTCNTIQTFKNERKVKKNKVNQTFLMSR